MKKENMKFKTYNEIIQYIQRNPYEWYKFMLGENIFNNLTWYQKLWIKLNAKLILTRINFIKK